ncbi:hypothetical protein [Pseudomonas farris]
MNQVYEEDNEPTNVVIGSPLNNAKIPPVAIPVSGSTSLGGTLPIVLRLYGGASLVDQATATISGNAWSATLTKSQAPGTYKLEVTQAAPTSITLILEVPAPVIQGPSGEIPAPQFTVQGNAGVVTQGAITLHNAANNGVLGNAVIQSNGNWSAVVTLPDQALPLTFYARQKIGSYFSVNSNQKTVTLLRVAPVIDSPKPGEVVVVGSQLLISGRGTPGKTIDVMKPGGAILHATAMVEADRTWEAVFNLANYPNGGTVVMQAGHRDMNDWSQPQSFTLLATPMITTPGNGAVTDPRGPISGGGGTSGAMVEVFKDLDHSFKVGQGTVGPNGQWNITTFTRDMPPGPFSIVARQTLQSVPSSISDPRAVKVRPPALTAPSVTFPTGTAVKFSGAGHTGATVEITVVSGPGGMAPPAVQVTGGRWETTATNWPFGNYQLTATQKVSDNAGGWIVSQPVSFAVTREMPDVSDVIFTTDYQPTFSGKGFTGATVRLFDEGGATHPAPDSLVSGGQWASRASVEWGPTFERPVHIKQFVGNQESPNYVTVKVTIPPLAPTINAPVENGLSPQLSGTCWPGAGVNIQYSDSVTVHRPSGNSGTWTFRRDIPFAPDITHTVTVTQTMAGQTSPAASQTFVVYAPIPQPVITYPTANSEVGRDVTVRGRDGMAGATMQLRDAQFGKDLGSPKTLTSNGEWSIDLRTLDFRGYTIDAKQVRNGRGSERSAPCVFEVVLLPPVIEVPQQGGKLPRTSKLSGTAMPGGRVEVLLEGVTESLLRDIPVDADGRWEGQVTLPVGSKTLRARQTFETQRSQDSLPRTYSVVPAAPFIETPATDEHIGRRAVISGFGVPEDTVTVKLAGAGRAVLGRSPVLEDRTWSVTLDIDLPGGRYSVVAVASYGEFDSEDSPERPVQLGTFMPVFDLPAAGHWAGHPVSFTGQGRLGSGQVVSWYNADQTWTRPVSVTAGRWQGEASQTLPHGGNWCRFKQTITDNADGATISDWADSRRFDVSPESEP